MHQHRQNYPMLMSFERISLIHFLLILGRINLKLNKVKFHSPKSLNLSVILVNVQNCAWTLVLQEILRLTSLFPHSMITGLCLLTELLPIPLPHTVRQVNSSSLHRIEHPTRLSF